MTTRTISDRDPRARIRELLACITVVNVETGKPLAPQAKLGRVIAACRGHIPTLVSIDWGSTSATEVRAALDALRGDDAPGYALCQHRARRFALRCVTPSLASRAGERVYKLGLAAQAREEFQLARDYFTLATALNEKRHGLIQCRLGSDGYKPHAIEAEALLVRIGGAA